ncbi:phosphotransferase family protein [Actinocorallia populi]|uniref:phosphotransferase family protein n=1 Tax=Actinocorallia populi TaxID=2079200 RepID=UPI000D096295|nr:aminoglycoside phosphotransferase family protein [Actinocorallia populi]
MSSPAWSTHGIVSSSRSVTKRFPEGGREACEREWRALELLATHAPGLAPEPLRLDLAAEQPTVVMSRLPGEPLRGAPLTEQKVKALAAAVRRLHGAVPPDVLAGLPLRPGHQREILAWLRDRASAASGVSLPGTVRRALDRGLAWLDRSGLRAAEVPDVAPVFGPGDGNIANYLWDGRRVQVVDFEESGRSDRAFELAEITEHVAAWVEHPLDVPLFLAQFDLTPAETARLRDCRRLLALVWLLLLAFDQGRNPAGTAERQAERLTRLLA